MSHHSEEIRTIFLSVCETNGALKELLKRGAGEARTAQATITLNLATFMRGLDASSVQWYEVSRAAQTFKEQCQLIRSGALLDNEIMRKVQELEDLAARLFSAFQKSSGGQFSSPGRMPGQHVR